MYSAGAQIYVTSRKGGSEMEKIPAILITFFLGGFGIHRFLAGKIGTGVVWMLTGGCFGIGWLVDLIMVCTGKFMKKDGTPWVTE